MKITYAIFYTQNIEVIKSFYAETLELNLASENDNFISFQLDNAILGIKLAEEEREIPGSQTVILSTDDVTTAYEQMKAASVEIYKEPSDEGWGLNFAILDPDGNKVEFVQI